MAYTLSSWKNLGTQIKHGPFGHKLFAISMGNENATSENTALLIHGFPEASFSFQKVIDGLLLQFDRVILLDLLGYGYSDKPAKNYSYSLLEQADTVFTVWKHLDIKGGHIIAHDMGDSVTTEILARHEHKLLPNWFKDGIQSITFTNGSMVLDFADLRITQRLLLSPFGKIFNRVTNYKLFSQQIRSAHGNAHLREEDIQQLWSLNKLNCGHLKTYQTIKYIKDRKQFEKTRWLPALAQTTLPIHICWGNDDSVANVKIAHYLKDEICINATLTIMENVGHFCQLDNPVKWIESIIAFYK